jgi:site-specific recombinase XerD
MPPRLARKGSQALQTSDDLEILTSKETATPQRFNPRLADAFIYKSISEATRHTYCKAIKGFFAFVGFIHPSEVTREHVISYRDRVIGKKKSANTVALKLPVIRSFYNYIMADRLVERNSASTKLISTPAISDALSGRVLTTKEVRYLLSRPGRSKPDGVRDCALMLLMLRLSLRFTESGAARLSNIKWSQGRCVPTLKVKRGRKEKWAVPPDVKQAVDDYLNLDRKRRALQRMDGADRKSLEVQALRI